MLERVSNITGWLILAVGYFAFIAGAITLLGWHDLLNWCIAQLGLDPQHLTTQTANFIKAIVTIGFTINAMFFMAIGCIVILLARTTRNR